MFIYPGYVFRSFVTLRRIPRRRSLVWLSTLVTHLSSFYVVALAYPFVSLPRHLLNITPFLWKGAATSCRFRGAVLNGGMPLASLSRRNFRASLKETALI